MKVFHKTLASGRWEQFSFARQMANIGSEVERAMKWKEKNDMSKFENAFARMLELIYLTIADKKNVKRLKEVTRMKEALIDYLYDDNYYNSTGDFFRKYFLQFAYYAGRERQEKI
jgi:hypothetical protein